MKIAHPYILVLCLSLIASLEALGQYQLTGIVRDENQNPIEEASIFVNNTSYGTDSQKDGTYSFEVAEGLYEIVVYHHGFEPISHSAKVDQSMEINFYL